MSSHHETPSQYDENYDQFNSSQQEPSQTQMTNEILTQNAEWTQMGDDEDDDDFVRSSQIESQTILTPSTTMIAVPPPPQPWGRFMPCSSTGQITHLFPRSPSYKINNSHNSNMIGGGNIGISTGSRLYASMSIGLQNHPTAFLRNVKPCDIFNVHTIGRSTKCDIQATNPSILCPSSRIASGSSSATTTIDKKIHARQEWCYGMISNRHCKIYCTVDALTLSNADIQETDSDEDIASKILSSVQIWVEDCSGNGTIINGTTILMKGDKRLLHSGDEICLVQKQTLQKKVVSRTELQNLLNEYSFVFVNCATNSNINTVAASRASVGTNALAADEKNDIITDCGNTGSRTKRKAAVNVRATKSTRIRHSMEPQNLPTALGNVAIINAPGRKRRSSMSSDFGESNMSQPPTMQLQQPNRRISPRRQQPRRVQEDYDIRDVLGAGTMGEVRRAIHRRTGEAVAIKVIPVKRTTKQNSNSRDHSMCTTTTVEIEMEASILRKLQHPYIVKLMDVYMCPTAVYLVMELVQGGDLFDRIVQRGQYTEIDSRRVMRRLFAAVHYLHESSGYGIVHRDLKPENILLTSKTSDIEVKLTDFGLAKQDGDLKTFCGTPLYFAPEVLRRRHTVKGNGRYGKQADMWSLGVILFVLLTGTPPFDSDDNNPHAILSSQSNGDSDNHMHLDFPTNISLAAQDMVRQLLQYDPRQRASIVSACTHEWILQDDGDTHTHPLEDPKLQSYTPPRSLPPTTTTNTTVMKPMHDKISETISLERSFAVDSPPSQDISLAMPSTEKTKKIATSAENFSFKKELYNDSHHHLAIIRSCGKERQPLLPIVVVAKTPVVLPTQLVPTTCKNLRQHVFTNKVTPVTELNDIGTDLGSPSGMNRNGKTQHLSTTTNLDRITAINEDNDEITSRFSENTESVGSFSTINTYEMEVKATRTTGSSNRQKSSRIEEDQSKSKSLLSKKKRSLSNVSPSLFAISKVMLLSDKTVKQSNLKHHNHASVTTRSSTLKKARNNKSRRFRTSHPTTGTGSTTLPERQQQSILSNETIQVNKKVAVVATLSSNGGDGRKKQSTLNNWFKKHN